MPHPQSPKKSLSLEPNDQEQYSSTGCYPFDHHTLGKRHERTHNFPPPLQVLQRLWDKALLTIPTLY